MGDELLKLISPRLGATSCTVCTSKKWPSLMQVCIELHAHHVQAGATR